MSAGKARPSTPGGVGPGIPGRARESLSGRKGGAGHHAQCPQGGKLSRWVSAASSSGAAIRQEGTTQVAVQRARRNSVTTPSVPVVFRVPCVTCPPTRRRSCWRATEPRPPGTSSQLSQPSASPLFRAPSNDIWINISVFSWNTETRSRYRRACFLARTILPRVLWPPVPVSCRTKGDGAE